MITLNTSPVHLNSSTVQGKISYSTVFHCYLVQRILHRMWHNHTLKLNFLGYWKSPCGVTFNELRKKKSAARLLLHILSKYSS